MLSLEHAHLFHSLSDLFRSSTGIHIQPAINKSYRDQLEVLLNSKPGSRRNKTVAHEELEKKDKAQSESVFLCVCIRHRVCPCLSDEGFWLVCDLQSHSWRKWQFAFSHNIFLPSTPLSSAIHHASPLMKRILLFPVSNQGFIMCPQMIFRVFVAFGKRWGSYWEKHYRRHVFWFLQMCSCFKFNVSKKLRQDQQKTGKRSAGKQVDW